jgi:hypothetical protein
MSQAESPEIAAPAEEPQGQKSASSARCGKPRVSDGGPCQQRAADCPWHSPGVTPADRAALARRGGLAARQVLPAATTPLPNLRNEQEVLAYVEEHARLTAIGELDTRVSAELRGWCMVALAAHELVALERLGRLEKIVRGRRVT